MPTILVIEDNTGTREMLVHLLKEARYDVIEARNGREALELSLGVAVNLIITDIFMPERDGLEVIRELRRRDPAAKIIAMSGGGHYLGFDPLQTAIDFGAVACLKKPFVPEQLRESVRSALS